MSRRWTYTVGGVPLPEPMEVSEDFASHAERMPLFTDRWMEGTRATDGTDIGSRARRREYMHVHGLAEADDYKNAWAKAAERRAEYLAGKAPPSAETKETVGRVAYELKSRNRSRR